MVAQFLRTPIKSTAPARPKGGVRPVWTFASVIFAVGSAFTTVATGSPRLIPAVAVATGLAAIVGTVRVMFFSR